MKPSRIFRLSRMPSNFHFVELAQLMTPTTSPPGLETFPIFQINCKIQLKVCLFNPLNEAESYMGAELSGHG